ncbi:unnamed protein product, partial [Mesorhabditis spiculigera]
MSCRFDFSGKKIVVTGGSQGIGRDICESLAASGATVYAMARNGQALEELQKKFPSNIIPLVCDVTAPIEELEAILAPHAPYDGLVNNAGVAVLETAMEARADSIDRNLP